MKRKLVDYGSDSDDDVPPPTIKPQVTQPTQPVQTKPESEPGKPKEADTKSKKITFESLLSNNLSNKSLKDKISSLKKEVNDWLPTKVEFAKPADESENSSRSQNLPPKKKTETLSEKFLKSLPKPKNTLGQGPKPLFGEDLAPAPQKFLIKEDNDEDGDNDGDEAVKGPAVTRAGMTQQDIDMLSKIDTQFGSKSGGQQRNIMEVSTQQLVGFDAEKYATQLQNAKELNSMKAPTKLQKSKNQLTAVAHQFASDQMIDPAQVFKESWKSTKGKYGW